MSLKEKFPRGGARLVLEGSQRAAELRECFSQALAVGADTLAVGSLGQTVRIYQRLATGWSLRQELTISSAATAIAMDGSMLALPGGEPGSAGRVVVYGRSRTLWVARVTLTAPDAQPYDNFGQALALSGSTLLATAQNVNPGAAHRGSAYVFVKTRAGWRLQAELTPTGADDRGEAFGVSAALDKDIAVVGAPPFAAYVFHRSGEMWTLEERLSLPDLTSASGFGSSVAVSGNLIVVGDSNGRGATVFSRVKGGWRRVADQLGASVTSVSVQGRTVAVGLGAPGSTGEVQVYRPNKYGWHLIQRIPPPHGAPACFGSKVALGNGVLAASAVDWATGQGAAYEFGPAVAGEESSTSSPLHPVLAAAVRALERGRPELLGVQAHRAPVAAPRKSGARLLVLTPYPHPARFEMISSSRMLTWGFKAHGIDYTLHHPGVERSDLDDFDAVFCWAYGFKQRPAALASCLEFEAEARASGVPVINSLASFSIAHSSCLRAWHGVGIPCAPYQHITCAADVTLPYPVILRTDGIHRGQHMHLARNRAEAEAVFARAALDPALPKPNLAIQFIDTRDADGYFRKWRSHVIGPRVVPRQVQLSTSWIVNLDGARPLPKAVKEDREFYRAGDPNPDILVRAAAALGSEIVALDYSKRGGEYIFWEGNRNFDLSVGGPMWRQFRTATGRSDAETVQSIFRLADNIAGHVLEVIAARVSTNTATQQPAMGR